MCLKCAIFEIVGEKKKDEPLFCCFCKHPIDIMHAESEPDTIPANATEKSRLLPNLRVRKLMADQLQQNKSMLTKKELHN